MYQSISPFIFPRPKKMTEVSLFFPVPFYQNALYLRAPHRLFPLGGRLDTAILAASCRRTTHAHTSGQETRTRAPWGGNGTDRKGRDRSKEGTYGGIVRLGGGERGGGLGGELVELAGGDAHVYPDTDLLRRLHCSNHIQKENTTPAKPVVN